MWGRCNPDSANGIDKTVYYLSRSQAELGNAVAIFSISAKPPIPVPGCEVRTYPPKQVPRFLKTSRAGDFLFRRSPANLPVALRDELLDWTPEIVHFHFVHIPQALRLATYLRKRRVPYCVSPHGGLAVEAQGRNRLGKRIFGALFERAYLNNAAFVHAVSRADVEGAVTYGVRNRFVLARNCIEPSLLPGDVDSRYLEGRVPAVAGRRLFLYVGRLDPEQKGLDLLLKAWSRVDRASRGALVLAGPDWRSGRARLQALVKGLRVADSVEFLGPVAGKDKWDALASAHVFVHPSRWEAGVPFSALEAMLASKPLLVTEPADPDALLSKAGIVTSPDEVSIGDGLARLMDASPADLEAFGKAGHELATAEFRWEQTSQRLLDAYEEAVEDGFAAPA